ncbi:MAG: polysaccharide biosynthesis tyrosine autokinase [Fuerstiella sp.]
MQNQVQDAPWASLDNMQGDEEEGLDIWGFLNRRKSFIILLAIVGSGLGYLYFQRQTPLYSSAALLQVIHHSSDPRVENMLAERNLSDSRFVITSRKLLEPCIESHNLDQLATLSGLAPEDAIRRLSTMITANSSAANILNIACKGSNPNDTAVIANAISAEYIKHQEESYQDAVGRLKQLLTRATDELSDSLTKLEDDYEKFDLKSPLLSNGANPHREQFAGIRAKINSLVIRETEIRAEKSSLEAALEAGNPRDAILMLIGKQVEDVERDVTSGTAIATATKEKDSSAQTMFRALMPLLLEESLLAEELGAGHPDLQKVRYRIELTQKYYERLAGMEVATEVPDAETPNPEQPARPDFIQIYLNSLAQDLNVIAQQKLEFQAMSDHEEAEAKKLREFENRRATFERRIARETSLLEDVQQQMRDTELPTNFGGVSASILTEARHGSLVYPKLSQFLGMGAFLGAFLGLALGYVVEAADRSFRKPEEIVREFGIPIVGHIPYIQDKKLKDAASQSTLDETIITQHLPRSRPAEAYRAVRTAVCFSAVGREHRVIQVTSPAAGDGKSTLAQNFAVALAQSGKKTIIVESDFRRPKVHKLTGVPAKPGIVDVLRGDVEVDDAIHQTEVENYYTMPCGGRPSNPSELLAMPEYEQLLEVLREKFDYVIVDTPPVLVVTDPCSVAPRVDGVLLCVRLSRHTRDFGRRSLEQLRDVGANMTGIVINGVEESDAYGYGNYNYSDYKYRYRDYSYTYSDKSNESYFEDEESSTNKVIEESSPAS